MSLRNARTQRTSAVAFVAFAAFAVLALFAAPAHAELWPQRIQDDLSNGSGYPGGFPLPARTLVLTIDDGPGALTLGLAQLLHERGIRATFIVNGNRIDANLDALTQAAALGHLVGNHLETHFRLTLDPSQGPAQMRACATRIAPFLGSGFHPFRPPYAVWTPAIHAALTATDEFDLVSGPYLHEIDGSDWACHGQGKTPEQCVDGIVARIFARPQQNGMIIVHEHVQWMVPTYHHEVIEGLIDRVAALPGAPFTWVPLDAIPGATGGLTAGPMTLASADFSDAAGFAPSANSATLRAGDVDGDGDDDVCARAASGVVCALADAGALGAATLWSPTFSDANGFDPIAFAATLQLADVDGDGAADLCVRAAAGLVCETSNGIDGFVPSIWSSADFSDAAGFASDESRYRSLRTADVDGDGRDDVCARDGVGVRCALSTEAGFAPATSWSAQLGDAEGFGAPEYGATLALGDLDRDGRADLCVRAAAGISCGLSDGASFAALAPWLFPGFSDAEGWTARSRFLALRLGDIDGDGRADLCGRNATGVECARSDGARLRDVRYAVNTNFLDVQGWDAESQGPTLLLARLDATGDTSICGRSPAGLVCHRAPPDPDHDGVGDPRDNCPARWNPDQHDLDANEVGDVCEFACSNGLDEDDDSLIDFPDDPGCTSESDVTETSACDDGADDDGDGRIDFPADPGCDDTNDDSETSPSLVCDNAIDDDGDTRVDHPADAGCSSPSDTTETAACSNGTDDDGDGAIDWPADVGCASEEAASENAQCQDGLDNDADGRFDFDGGASRNAGVPIGDADPDCESKPWKNSERTAGCGLGLELALLMPLLAALRRRKLKRAG